MLEGRLWRVRTARQILRLHPQLDAPMNIERLVTLGHMPPLAHVRPGSRQPRVSTVRYSREEAESTKADAPVRLVLLRRREQLERPPRHPCDLELVIDRRNRIAHLVVLFRVL